MKYIMFERQGQLVPVIFPDFINHREVANALTGHLTLSRAKPVSAGTCEVYCTSTSGASSTLEVEAKTLDAQTINVYDYCHGMEPPTGTVVQLVREATRRAMQEAGAFGVAVDQTHWQMSSSAECSGACGCMGDDPDCPVHGDRVP